MRNLQGPSPTEQGNFFFHMVIFLLEINGKADRAVLVLASLPASGSSQRVGGRIILRAPSSPCETSLGSDSENDHWIGNQEVKKT